MQRISRAPLLSATLRMDSCWIMSRASLLGLLEDLGDPPALVLGQRPRLDDAHPVADTALVGLVVRLEAGAMLDDLLVQRMRLELANGDHDGLVHPIAHH